MRNLRRSHPHSSTHKWNDFVSKSEVSRRSGLEVIRQTVQQRRLGLFGHVARLPTVIPASVPSPDSISSSATDGVSTMPAWKRSRGHPPKTWLKQITADPDSPHCCWCTYTTCSGSASAKCQCLHCCRSSNVESSRNGHKATR